MPGPAVAPSGPGSFVEGRAGTAAEFAVVTPTDRAWLVEPTGPPCHLGSKADKLPGLVPGIFLPSASVVVKLGFYAGWRRSWRIGVTERYGIQSFRVTLSI